MVSADVDQQRVRHRVARVAHQRVRRTCSASCPAARGVSRDPAASADRCGTCSGERFQLCERRDRSARPRRRSGDRPPAAGVLVGLGRSAVRRSTLSPSSAARCRLAAAVHCPKNTSGPPALFRSGRAGRASIAHQPICFDAEQLDGCFSTISTSAIPLSDASAGTRCAKGSSTSTAAAASSRVPGHQPETSPTGLKPEAGEVERRPAEQQPGDRPGQVRPSARRSTPRKPDRDQDDRGDETSGARRTGTRRGDVGPAPSRWRGA